MSCRYGSTPDRRVSVELVEAGVEIGFVLVDMLESWPAETDRILDDAEGVYADVSARLNRLPSNERENVKPLVAELRRAIDRATPSSPAAAD
jgi:hypothetical protein